MHPHNPNTGFYLVEGSFRAGGKYEIAYSERYTTREDLNPDELARLTSFLVEQRMLGVEIPRITRVEVLRAKENNSLPVHERADRLLRLLANQSSSIGEVLEIFPLGLGNSGFRNELKITYSAMAWSESTTDEELIFLTDYLAGQGWVTKDRQMYDGIGIHQSVYGYLCRVEVPGYSRIEEITTNPDSFPPQRTPARPYQRSIEEITTTPNSSQCFVAMWFDDSMKDVYEKGFETAIKAACYTPFRINDAPGIIGDLYDAITDAIRRSRFVVADFTHGDGGARGGVYYEAGFARGLGLPVIFTCRKDMIDKAHFDIRQFYHILWEPENPEDLRKQLTDRIMAAIGQGPNRNG